MLNPRKFPSRQMGVSMIEVMVALVLIALTLLGLMALQTRTLAYNQSSFSRTIATDAAADLADRIRANRSPVLVSADAEEVPLLAPDFSRCTVLTLSQTPPTCEAQLNDRQPYRVVQEMDEWYRSLQAQLPGAGFALMSTPQADGSLGYTLTISWLDDHIAGQNEQYRVDIE